MKVERKVLPEFKSFLQDCKKLGESAGLVLSTQEGDIFIFENIENEEDRMALFQWKILFERYKRKCECSCTKGTEGARELSLAFHNGPT